ncbi:hypothetical protein Pfo_013355 [Paulownia fortunei]|nr:hypothetical protein Pfo_013355 [Paulownia fortunei]
MKNPDEHSFKSKTLVVENADKRKRSKNRGPSNWRDKSMGKSKSKTDFKYHYYDGTNHYEIDCRKKKRDQRNENNENKKDTTIVAANGDVVIVCDDACIRSLCQHTDWIIDSGAS